MLRKKKALVHCLPHSDYFFTKRLISLHFWVASDGKNPGGVEKLFSRWISGG